MSTAELMHVYTPEDLLKMPDGNRYELVDGQLVEKQMSFWSSYVAGEVHAHLRDYARQQKLGWVVPEGTTYQCFPDSPGKVRKPDVSFIRNDRLSPEQAAEEGHLRIPPDLAAEVVSPNDSYYEVETKVDELLNAGVKVVWVINPNNRTARVHRADGAEMPIHENEELSAEDVLPGFRLRLGDLFQPPPKNG